MPFDKIQSFLEINPEYAWLLLFLFGFMESMIITGSFMSSAILFSICIYLYNSGILTLPWICGFALLGSHFGDVVGSIDPQKIVLKIYWKFGNFDFGEEFN